LFPSQISIFLIQIFSDSENLERDDQNPIRNKEKGMNQNNIQKGIQNSFKPNILHLQMISSTYGFREKKEGLIRPKPIHPNLPEKEPCIALNLDANKDAETRS
jgi:hypothetical protein